MYIRSSSLSNAISKFLKTDIVGKRFLAYTVPSRLMAQHDFPTLEKSKRREQKLLDEPEPNYEKLVSGFSTYRFVANTKEDVFKLIHGGELPEFNIAYESWGQLNEAKDNAILLHTGLSASSHARSHKDNVKPGWWETFIGPGLALDTNKYHVICTNVLGGCYGSTGPSSFDPDTEREGGNRERFGTRFPILTIFDMVRAQFNMLDHMGIKKLHASVGSSMGGMQSLAAAALFPERVGKLVSISACARSNPYSIALRFAQRQVLMGDLNWNRGFYYDKIPPHQGMKLARQIATITYRSGPEWEERFGRARKDPSHSPSFGADYLIENYLDHQGEKWCLTYDPNSLLYISKAMDMFDLSYPIPTVESPFIQEQELGIDPVTQRAALVKGMSSIQMPALILGVQTDVLFPVWQQKEIADCLKEAGNKHVKYYELDAKFGHDSFLLLNDEVGGAIKGHLELEF